MPALVGCEAQKRGLRGPGCAAALALAGEGCPWEAACLPQKQPFLGSWVPGGTRSAGNGVGDGRFRALILQALLARGAAPGSVAVSG